MNVFESYIAVCEGIIGWDFVDKTLCAMALTTVPGVFFLQGELRNFRCNDNIAVYGDAVSRSYLCRKWFDAGLDKGQWTQIFNNVLGNNNLEDVGRHSGLHHCVVTNPGTPTVSPRTMATTVEAILGAVHLDGGDAALGQVMDTLGLNHPLLA
ncbi:uncharacterized protein EI97DRAFT_372268 [Westerdykella ornata]|uniref:RNase III domain-containing protein n=1 Tax=Westerdykella ornata TaxID=318751 RepID=A0A6A6JRD5_WESOR|nr:uncharacterized protein EI97DRAFT_372268 [Westerdykella ornata]KAF2278957.1 hypothetical protein EI97DRAFT_372268 [Westerdykella ornata]